MVRVLEKVEEAGRRVSVVELVHDGSRRYYDGGVLYTGVDAAGNNTLDYVDAMAMAMIVRQSVETPFPTTRIADSPIPVSPAYPVIRRCLPRRKPAW